MVIGNFHFFVATQNKSINDKETTKKVKKNLLILHKEMKHRGMINVCYQSMHLLFKWGYR